MAGIPALDSDTCPVCKSDRYLNPTLRLLVSPCFHKMCDTCINRLYLQGPAPCPICRTRLRKQDFVAQTFEDLYVEKEIQQRKLIARVYNKRPEDFKNNLKAYNNYLEEVEDILFNLINDIDVAETKARIERYKAENQQLIGANLQKQMIEERTVQGGLEREKREKIIRKETYEQAVIEEAKVKKQAKADIIRRLAEEDTSASDVIAEAQARRPRAPDIDKLLQARLPTYDDGAADQMLADVHTSPFEPLDHPYAEVSYTTIKAFYSDPWQNHLRMDEPARGALLKASGYMPKFAYERAITSAFAGIFAGIS
ncbi:TFIIH/NER complex subunit [Geranomyces variabilis]|nr:TFIIH/NER complex subunit [Geranomyces variabilis]